MTTCFYPDKMPSPPHGSVVTVGSFDGVHRGHRVLLDAVQSRASSLGERGVGSVVVTFANHPRHLLGGSADFGLLTTTREKASLLSEAGIDNMAIVPFDKEIASMSPREFVEKVLVGWLGVGWLVVGHDHRFGRAQEGDYELLETLSKEFGFGLDRVDEFRMSGTAGGVAAITGDSSIVVDERSPLAVAGNVSSSTIRNLIAHGEMEQAARLLGRGYMIVADIVDGEIVPVGSSKPESGRTVISGGGFILPSSGKLLPPAGEYRVKVGVVHDIDYGVYSHLWSHEMLRIDESGGLRLECDYDDCNAVITFV